ncbi:MAG TPA: pectin acetylesterase-family hydrolase [Anaerolineales bacterium]|nr:pectin acetylesterase-family hydrolase [Anaerolineales bacterium]
MKPFIGSLILIVSLFLAACQLGQAHPLQQVTGKPPVTESARAASPATAQPSAPPALTKHVVKDAAQRQAVCNDGSPAVYYFNLGSGADAAHWLIFFQGGGYCSSDPSCAFRWNSQHDLMTSQGAPNKMDGAGIFSSSDQENPDFANFTQVFIKYCSSDIYSGDTERPVGGMQMQFRGHKIVAAIVADLEDSTLIPSPNLKDATQVLVSGSSAGSFGAASNMDWIASQLPWAKVKGVLDSSWVPPLPDYGSGPLIPQPGSAAFYDYFSAVPDPSCAAAEPGQPQICLSTVQLYPFLTTPVFIYAEQRDPTLSQTKGVTDPNDPAQAAYMTQYAASVRESLKNVTAVFSPAAGIHTALTDDNFTAIKVDGYDFQQLLGNWYFGRSGPIRIIAGETQ